MTGAKGEDPDRYVTDMKEKKSGVTKASLDLLEKVDVTKMGREEYKALMMRKIRGTASPEDLTRIQKYHVQEHYTEPVDAALVMEFNKKKRAIYNQTFMKRFPQEVRRKIHSNTMIMKDSLDTVNADIKLIPGFQKTLTLMGFETADDSKTRIDLKRISKEASDSMESVLELTRTVKLDRKPRSDDPFTQFKSHLDKLMGYELSTIKFNGKDSPPRYTHLRTRFRKSFWKTTCTRRTGFTTTAQALTCT